MRLIDADLLEKAGLMLMKLSDKQDKLLTKFEWKDVPTAFDVDAVYRKMWRESEEVCGNTMIDLERANEIIAEALSGGVE